MKNVYWTIRYSYGWLDNRCHSTRSGAIAAYLNAFSNGSWKDKTWRWHKRRSQVSVVRVQLVEVTK